MTLHLIALGLSLLYPFVIFLSHPFGSQHGQVSQDLPLFARCLGKVLGQVGMDEHVLEIESTTEIRSFDS